jgi:RES domain-containing protein
LLVWRLCRRRLAAFDGEGARLAGGRWNRPGTPVVYTSATLSLAALEYFVHLDPEDRPEDLVAVSARIPEDLRRTTVDAASLPRNWRSYPAPERLAAVGMRWIEAGETAVAAVPSALVPQEWNYLLNPAHPDFGRIEVGAARPFAFDARMRKRSDAAQGAGKG